jgi:hypothetical protein
MQSNKGLENEPIAGNGFFNNRPSIGKISLSPMRQLNGFKQVISTGTTETPKFQKPERIFVKGFGATPLFVLGMVKKAEDGGQRLRLDDDTSRKGRLSEAEQICKRNSTMVKKLHQEEEQLEKNTHYSYEACEYEIIPTNLPDETLASDCRTKTRKFNLRKQAESSTRDGVD